MGIKCALESKKCPSRGVRERLTANKKEGVSGTSHTNKRDASLGSQLNSAVEACSQCHTSWLTTNQSL